MDDYKISDILFSALSKPFPVEYLNKEQKESGYPELVFWRLLLDALVHYYNVIQSKISEWNSIGNSITDYRLALYSITNGKYTNHFGKNEVTYLADVLRELAKLYCLPEQIYFSTYPLHDLNNDVAYVENELNNLWDHELKIKFLTLHVEKTQVYIDNLIKISVEHPALKIEGERADRLNKAKAFLVFLKERKTKLINNPPPPPIILEAKGGVAMTSTLLASASTAARLFVAPLKYDEFCKLIPEFSNLYFEIDTILNEDNNGPFIFPALIKKTKDLISLIPSELIMDFIESMKLQISSFRIKKLNELKYDDSYYIDHTPKQMGVHTEQSRFVKASKESIEIKLNLLNEYDKWLANEEEQFKKIQPIMTNTGNNFGTLGDNDKVLNRDEYFQIIMEIYNLHWNTIGEFVAAKIKNHLPTNPQFIECLYKDINKILEGVHRPGDLDLDISSGDFENEFGDIKLTGKVTILDDALTFLWVELSKLYVEKWGILNLTEHLKAFETNIILRDDYTPAYAKKIAELNKELKIASGIEIPIEKNKIEKKGGANKRYAIYVESYNQYANIENLPHLKAVKKTCNQYGISEKTLMRALKPQ